MEKDVKTILRLYRVLDELHFLNFENKCLRTANSTTSCLNGLIARKFSEYTACGMIRANEGVFEPVVCLGISGW